MKQRSMIQSPLEIKSLSAEGTFSGYASVFNVVDAQKDVVLPGAFHYSLKQWKVKGKLPFLLWQHHLSEPIGFWKSLREDDRGLYVEGQVLLNLTRGKEAYFMMKAGILEGLSIGFIPIVARKSPKKSVRNLYQIDLVEISLVTLPANPEAQLRQVKHLPHSPRG